MWYPKPGVKLAATVYTFLISDPTPPPNPMKGTYEGGMKYVDILYLGLPYHRIAAEITRFEGVIIQRKIKNSPFLRRFPKMR